VNIPTTVEVIPVKKFPIQGSIIGDLKDISDEKIEFLIFSNFSTFIDVGDTLPLIVRGHYKSGFERELEATVIEMNILHGITSVACDLMSGVKIEDEILEEMQDAKLDTSILKRMGTRRV